MKKIKWLYIIAFALLANCATKEDKQTAQLPSPSSDTASQKAKQGPPKEKTKTVISLAQLAIDTIFASEKLLKTTKAGNLKKLWDYDEKLYSISSKSGKFIVAKEINPCCPCSDTNAMCCQCLVETEFAAVTDMEAKASLDGTSIKVEPSPFVGVDLFALPPGITGRHVLKISGISNPGGPRFEVTYNIEIVDGTIRFN
ncbi:MAG TPA: hypothetical protein VFU05_20205 [Cyclobacteriaceae bacterium]|nr:hypothetical protein [Cyclobacteriaceae bacterium]